MAHLSKEELLNGVEDFAREENLEYILPVLKKGALVAQNTDFESIQELEQEDLDILHHEKAYKWDPTKGLYLTIIMCSVGAAVQYDFLGPLLYGIPIMLRCGLMPPGFI